MFQTGTFSTSYEETIHTILSKSTLFHILELIVENNQTQNAKEWLQNGPEYVLLILSNRTYYARKLPYKEKDIEKKYYTIGEVAALFKVAPSLIRFWETEFDIIQPQKNRRGNRQFTRDDIENIRLIYGLVKEKGYTLQGAKEIIKTDRHKAKDNMDLLESLQRVRAFLVDLKKQMDE